MNATGRPRLTRARALATLLTLLVGVPAILTWAAGSPLPPYGDVRGGIENVAPEILLLRLVIAGTWVLWAQFAACVLVEALAAGRRGAFGPPVPFAGPAQHIARRLIATLTVATATASVPTSVALVPAAASQAIAAPPHQAIPALVTVASTGVPAAPTDTSPTTVTAPRPGPVDRHQLRLYIVQPPYGGHHDTLWGAAERYLGDGSRLDEIVALNVGCTMPDGRVFTDKDFIHPGWPLLMPPDARGLPLAYPDASPPRPAKPAPNRPVQKPMHSSQAPSPTATPALPPAAVAPTKTIEFPSGTVVAASFIAGLAVATAAGRLRRRWLYEPRPPAPAVLPTPEEHRRSLVSAPYDTVADNDETEPATPDIDPPNTDVAPWLIGGLRTPTPARIPVGHRDGDPIELDLVATGPITIIGDHAMDTARAIVATFLAQSGPLGARVLIPADTYDLMLPGIPPFPGLIRTATAAEALAQLDVERLHRARHFDAVDAPDFRTYRSAHDGEPIPAVLLVTSDLNGLAAVYNATLHNGETFGITGLHLGEPAVGSTVNLDADGTVVDAAPHAVAALLGVRAYTLAAADAADAFDRLASAVSDPDELTPLQDGEPAIIDVAPAPDSPAASSAPIYVQLLGAYQIRVHGTPIRTGLFRTARELLAFYLLHPHGASPDTAVETLWPDTPARGAGERFRNAFKNLHRTLEEATGIKDPIVLRRDGEPYRIDPALLDTDLWHFQAGLRNAKSGPPEGRIAALHDALDQCRGPLLAGYTYEWVEPIREELRRHALDAVTQLVAHHTATGDTATTIELLEGAIQLDPYAEHFYADAMRIHADAGRHDAARRLFAQLESRLSELEVEPSIETRQLLDAALDSRQPTTAA